MKFMALARLTACSVLYCCAAALAGDVNLAPGVVVAPGDQAPIPVTLASPAPAGGVMVTLTSSDTSRVVLNFSNVYIPAGATAPFIQPQVRGIDFGSASISASAWGLTGDTQLVRVAATLLGPAALNLQVGSTQTVAFTLSAPTPTGLTLALRSDAPSIATVPQSAAIAPGASAAYIPIAGAAAGSTTIRLSAPAIGEKTLTATVTAPGTITLGPMAVALGRIAPVPIILGTPAPAAGLVVNLASSAPNVVSVAPSSLFFAAGATTPAAQAGVTGVNIGAATITASASGYAPASQVVPVPASLTFSPLALTIPQPGTTGRLLLALSDSAPWGPESSPWSHGLTVQLSSSDPTIVMVPGTADFYPDGSSFTAVTILATALRSGVATIRASAPPFIPETTATVTVLGSGALPASISASGGTPQTASIGSSYMQRFSASVRDAGGVAVPGVVVTFTAPASGASGNFAGGVNTAVTNAAGIAVSAEFIANGIPGSYIVQAFAAGVAAPASFLLTNTATSGGAVVLPSNLIVGTAQPVSFPVSLSSPAPSGGVVVNLISSDPATATVAPSTVFIAAGTTAALVQPQVTGVNYGSAMLTASAAGYAGASQPVQVRAGLSFLQPAFSIPSGMVQTVSLALSAPAPAAGLSVSLSSSNPAAATVPATISFPANAITVGVPVTGVAAGTSAISATAANPNVSGATALATVTGTGSQIRLASGIVVAPGESAVLPVTLSTPAGASGVFVSLASSDTTKVTLNVASVFIAAGAIAPALQPRVQGITTGTANVTASAAGLGSDTQQVRVTTTLSGPSGATVNRGSVVNLTFTLPSPTPTAIPLTASSDNTAIASVPAAVSVPANGYAAVVPVTGAGNGSTVIRVSAAGISEKTVNITVVSPASITLPTVSARMGQLVPFPVTLGTPAPAGGVFIALASNAPLTVTVSPSSVYVAAGSTMPAVQPQVTGVNIGAAVISASAPGYVPASQTVVVPATVTISPAALTISGIGNTARIFVALSTSAPWGPDSSPWSNGLTVQLSSSNPSVAAVPASIDFYPDGSSFTTIVVLVRAVGPGVAVIRTSAPFAPESTSTVTVVP